MKQIKLSNNKCSLFAMQDNMMVAFKLGNFEKVEAIRKEILQLILEK
ncbi:hypothetical protein [Amedibacterium intestinale]